MITKHGDDADDGIGGRFEKEDDKELNDDEIQEVLSPEAIAAELNIISKCGDLDTQKLIKSMRRINEGFSSDKVSI